MYILYNLKLSQSIPVHLPVSRVESMREPILEIGNADLKTIKRTKLDGFIFKKARATY